MNENGSPPPLPPPLAEPEDKTAVVESGDVCLDLGGEPNLLEGREPKNEVKKQFGKEFFIGDDDSTSGAATPTSLANTDMFAKAAAEEAFNTESARWISIISLVASLVAASLGFGIGYTEESLSLIGFGLESMLDGVSSAFVLWRFKRPKVRQHEDPQAAERFHAARGARRERHSGLGIGVIFIASSVLLLASATYKLVAWDPNEASHLKEEEEGANISVLLSLPAALVFGVLAVVKFSLGRRLSSQVLLKDAFCSLLGAGLALICGIAGIIEEHTDSPENVALVDVVAGATIALILGVEGCRTLRHNAVKVDTSTTAPDSKSTSKAQKA